jgi:ABC-2 type transport system permease protein
MRTILFLLRKEYLQVFRNPAMLVIVFVTPALQLLLLSSAATFEVRSMRVHVVDEDRTSTSRRLVERFAASGYFVVAGHSPSGGPADEALLRREASMILRIPRAFERDLVRTRAGRVQLVLNAEDGAAAGVAQSYAARILTSFRAEVAGELRPELARAAGRPPAPRRGGTGIAVERRGWYNPGLDYQAYMVPGILVLLVTVSATLLTALNITREKEIGTLEQLNVTPITRSQFIAGKLLPFWLLALVQLAVGTVLAELAFDIPMRGSVALVFAVAAVYLLVALGIGLWISTITETQQQAMFITFFVLIIYMLMSGLFTPIASMPRWAQLLAELNPVAHFIRVVRAVLVKGAGLADVQGSVGALAAYAAAVLALAVRQYSKTSA